VVVERGAQGIVSIAVSNTASHDINLIGVVDGSEAGARYPRWTPIVEGSASLFRPERSDFTSPLGPGDFRLLKPGQVFDPTVPAGDARFFPLATFETLSDQPGLYRVTLELDTQCDDERAWIGTLPVRGEEAERAAAAVRARMRDVPRLRVRSNTIEIMVR
jgi:hypothetical protein